MSQNPEAHTKPKKGYFVLWEGKEYVIDDVDIGSFKAYLRDMEDGKLQPIPIDVLLTPDKNGKKPIIAKNREDLYKQVQAEAPRDRFILDKNLPQNLLKTANRIIHTVEQVRKQILKYQRITEVRNEKLNRKDTIILALKELKIKISWRSFYYYEKLYKKARGDAYRLAVIKRRSDFRKTRHSSAELHLIHKAILRYGRFLNPTQLLERIEGILENTKGLWVDPKKFAADIPEALIEDLLDPEVSNIDFILQNPDYQDKLCRASPPKKSWFYNYVRWFQTLAEGGREFVNRLLGDGAWEEEYKVFDSFVQRSQYPNQYVFADHYLIDVFNVDEENRSVINRLWLTLLIDAYSRAILGYCLTYEKPSAETLLLGLKNTIYPKIIHQKYGIEKPWVCFGIPQFLFLDNAWGHHAADIERLAKEISQDGEYPSIDLVFRVPYLAIQGALIERFFGNLSGKIKAALAGAIKNSNPKWVTNAVKSACLIYDDIDEFIVKVIVNYMHTPHSGIHMMTPHDKYVQGLKYTQLPDYPDFTPEFEQLFWRSALDTRTIQDDGVEWIALDYWAPELSVLPRFLPHVGTSDGTQDKSTRNKRRMPYSLRYNTENISEVGLYQDGKFICLIRAKQFRLADGSYREISLWEWEMAKALMPSGKVATADLVKLLLETDEKNEIRLKERQTALNKARKQNDVPPLPPMSPAEIDEALKSQEQAEIDKELNKFMFSDSDD